VCLLKLPAKAGDEWEVRSTRNEVEFKLTATVRKVEKVKVPAGTFEAVPVVLEGTVGGRTITATQWYAPGVGLVKVNQGETTIEELKSFTPGKK
jgi:hypothetical protein